MPINSDGSSRDEVLIDAAARQFEALRAARVGNPEAHAGRGALDAGAPPLGVAAIGAHLLAGYELLRELHRGGQGVVFEALQKATKRKVAIKILHESTTAVAASRRRFELEIEILSQLRHPNIVTVHDSGQAGERFFYVMDLVPGIPLDRWVEQRRRERRDDAVRTGSRGGLRDEIGEILQLFVKICDAVNAAHLRGVIHRDLKPGNILIDGAGEPHVLDFGLAKYTFGMPDDPSVAVSMTQAGQFVGSLPWSSPEQASGASGEMDIRSDVYALGVLLYQSLTGQFPYRVVGEPLEILKQVCNAEPRDMNDARRQCHAVNALVTPLEFNNEVQTIVLKCLQKDRERRYQTAGDLGRDLQHYLRHEPIQAKRDSLGYVLRKQLRRHRLAVAASVAVLAALSIGLVVSLIFWHRAEQRQQLANTKREEADAVVKLLEGLFGSSDAFQFPGPDATIKQVVEGYAATVFKGLEGKPEVELRMRNTLGNAYYNMAEFVKAEEQFTRAVELARGIYGPNSPRVSEMLGAIGSVHLATGANEKAEQAFRAALVIDQASRSDPDCLEADSLLGLGAAVAEQGRFPEAEKVLRESVQVFDSKPDARQAGLPEALGKLAKLMLATGRAADAEPLLRQALATAEKRFGPADPRTATARSDLASLFFKTNRAADAVALYEAAAAADAKFYGERDPRRALELSNLAIVLKSLGQLDRAEALHREALAIRREKLAADDPATALSLEGIATVLEARRAFADAQPYYDEAAQIDIARKAEDADTLRRWVNQARIRYLQKKFDEAATFYEQVLASQLKELPPDNADVLATKLRLAVIRRKLGQTAAAQPLLAEYLAARAAHSQDNASLSERDDKNEALLEQGLLCVTQGNVPGARVLLEGVRADLASYKSRKPLLQPRAEQALADVLCRLGEYAKAREMVETVLPHVDELAQEDATLPAALADTQARLAEASKNAPAPQ